MRIVILVSILSPWGRATAEMLARLGHEIHVFDFEERKGIYHSDASQAEAVKDFQTKVAGFHLFTRLGASNLRYLTAVPQFRRRLRNIKPDILLTLYAGGFAQLAFFSGFRPYAVFAVGSDVLLQEGWRRRMARFTFESAAVVFANGGHLAEKAQEMAPRAIVKPLLLGIDMEKFVPEEPATPPEFLCNRGFREPYNNDCIIQALALLDATPPFTFHFASAGPDLEASKRLAKQILPVNIRQRVIFWGGVSAQQMMTLIHRSSFFVSMSRSDGTATSLLEAMACGLFPILSDIPQNREWVDVNRGNGFVVPVNDPHFLAECIREVLANPSGARQFGSYNRQLVQTRADSRNNLEQLISELNPVAQPSRNECRGRKSEQPGKFQ